jgi:hypothetical protein
MTSRVGYRIPCRSAGMFLLSHGKIVESQEKRRQKLATKPNWMRVRVAGLGKALRMDFEEVFVKALERYHIIQRIYGYQQDPAIMGELQTINLGETGAFSAFDIS